MAPRKARALRPVQTAARAKAHRLAGKDPSLVNLISIAINDALSHLFWFALGRTITPCAIKVFSMFLFPWLNMHFGAKSLANHLAAPFSEDEGHARREQFRLPRPARRGKSADSRDNRPSYGRRRRNSRNMRTQTDDKIFRSLSLGNLTLA